eukprot:TRINITY_DN16339_c0_g1_i1.p1 TRINITY_DN16339_c0_g1~~TRINITY_DN16339_c0_g1_i1.p1  ORF type:complete len:264 (+),score=52.09 TRINITY_DN16339_c0_g1_i1:63-794(+)
MVATGMPVISNGQKVSIGNSNVTLHVSSEEPDDDDTTASAVWGAGLALAQHVIDGASNDDSTLVHGATVLELGSGTGVCGLACAAAQAEGVVLTDLAENVERLDRAIAQNAKVVDGCDVRAAALPWADVAAAQSVAQETFGSFDVIVAADCNFCHTLHEPLAETLVALCKIREREIQKGETLKGKTRILFAEELRWKDISAWWQETALEKGLSLQSEVELTSPENVDRKILLREYTVDFAEAY